jgi:MFS transporter, PPP family, 3-phenylpropionic acid transporter
MCRCAGAGRPHPGLDPLTAPGPAADRPPAVLSEGGVRALFFAYFAFVGIFSPYLSLWLDRRGLSITEIAVLMALPQLLRIVAPPFWGWAADRSGRRVALLRFAAIAAFAVLLAFPFASRPLEYGALMLMLCFLTAAQMPIGEAIALDLARGDAGRYGRMRLWGSVGFILTVVAGGPVLAALGLDALPWVMAGTVALLAAVTLRLPDQRTASAARAAVSIADRLREPAVLAFLASAFLMQFAHAALYAFFSLFLERNGYGTTAIGAIWGLGVAAEIALFMGQRRLFARASPMRLLLVCFGVCALRFAMIAASGGSLAVLLLGQLMHAVTFGLHHSASMAVLHGWFEPAQQARAQAAFIVVAYGLGGSCGGLAAGLLWQRVSPASAFAGAAVAALLGGLAVLLAMRSTPDPAVRPAS